MTAHPHGALPRGREPDDVTGPLEPAAEGSRNLTTETTHDRR